MAPSASDVGREVLAGEHGSAGEEVRRGALDDGLPPSWPAPGPTTMIQSACAITAWWCSMTMTDLPTRRGGGVLAVHALSGQRVQ